MACVCCVCGLQKKCPHSGRSRSGRELCFSHPIVKICKTQVCKQIYARSLKAMNSTDYFYVMRFFYSLFLSLIQFFNKMKKWSDMANLPQDFREKVDGLERNFAVSTVIFKKYQPIFLDIFRDPADDPPRQTRSRKQRYGTHDSACRVCFCLVEKLYLLEIYSRIV